LEIKRKRTTVLLISSVAERVKAPFLWRPCDHDCVI